MKPGGYFGDLAKQLVSIKMTIGSIKIDKLFIFDSNYG